MLGVYFYTSCLLFGGRIGWNARAHSPVATVNCAIHTLSSPMDGNNLIILAQHSTQFGSFNPFCSNILEICTGSGDYFHKRTMSQSLGSLLSKLTVFAWFGPNLIQIRPNLTCHNTMIQFYMSQTCLDMSKTKWWPNTQKFELMTDKVADDYYYYYTTYLFHGSLRASQAIKNQYQIKMANFCSLFCAIGDIRPSTYS